MVKWVNLAVNIQFTHPSGNQLGILRSEIDDQDLLMHVQK